MSKRTKNPFQKRKGVVCSSREVLAGFDLSMNSPDSDSGSLYDKHKDPSRHGVSCRGMRSFKKQRTDSCITDLTTDSDSEESPLVAVLLESAAPTRSGRPPESDWLGARHGSLRGGGGGSGGRGRGRGRGEGGGGGVRPTQGKLSDFVSSVNGSGSRVWQSVDAGFENSQRPLPSQTSSLCNPFSPARLHSRRDFRFVASMESSLPPLQSQSPRKRTQTNQETSVSTRCTVATMNYPQQPSAVEGGARQRIANEDAPNMGRMRNLKRRSRNESRRSGSSFDDVMVIELPSADEQHCPLVGTMESLRAVSQEADVRRSSRGDRPHQRCDSIVHSSQLHVSHQRTGASGTLARTMQTAAVRRGNDQSLGLESDMAVFSPPIQSHSSGKVKQSNADQVGGRVMSGNAVSMLQRENVGPEKDSGREMDEFSPIQRAYYELSPGLQCTDGTSNQVSPSDCSVTVSKPDSASGSDVVCIGSDGEDNCSYVTTTSVYFEPKKKGENLEQNDRPECSIVSWQNCSLSSGIKGAGVPLSDTLVREQLRSTSAGHAVAANQSTHGSYHPLLGTPTSSGLLEAQKRSSDVANSNRGFTSMPSAGGHGTTNRGSMDRQFDSPQIWLDLSSSSTGSCPLPTNAKGESVSATRRTREGTGQSADLLPSVESHCDVSLVEVGDSGTGSDDDFEKPKRKQRNCFAISESNRRAKPLVFSQQPKATPGDTPSRPPKKEGSILEATPRKTMCSKPEERSVFDHLHGGNQRGNSSPLLPTPISSSPRLTVTAPRKKSTSEDEVVFQGEEVKKSYPLRNKRLHLPSVNRDWYSDQEEPKKRGTGITSSSQLPSSSNASSFYGPSLPSYGKSMVAAAVQKGKGSLPQSYSRVLRNAQLCVPKLKTKTSDGAQGKRKVVPRQPSTQYTLKDELDSVQMEVASAQVGRLNNIDVLSPAELMAEELKLNLDIDDKTHRMMIQFRDIAEWKMNLSSEPMLVALTLWEGPAKQLANRLSSSFHLDAKFYNPKSKDESEKFIIFHLTDTPPPTTIVKLNEILDGAKESCLLTMTIDKELDPTEATDLLKRVEPSKPARTAVRVQQLSRDPDILTTLEAPRRSSRVAKKRKGEGPSEREEVVRRRKGNPNKKVLSYKPTGSKLNLEIVDADLDCLYRGEYLNDKIIDFYLMYLYYEVLEEGHRSRVHIFSSFFHTRLKDSSRDNHELSTPERIHDRVKTWTRHVDLFSKDYIVLPVCDRAHWFIVFICHPGLFNPDNVIKCQPRSKRIIPTRNKRGRTTLKKRRKPQTPKGAIVLSDSSQEELEAPVGGDEEEAPLPKSDGGGCEGGEGESVEGVEELDMEEFEKFSECGDGGEVVGRGEGVVPGAVLQDAAEREVEEVEGSGAGAECMQTVAETSSITLQGLEDSLDVPDSQMVPDSEMEEGESTMEVGHGDDDSSEDGVTSVRRNGHSVCRLDSESEGEEGAPGMDAPSPHSQDMVTPAEIKVERTEEEENVAVCTSSSTKDTAKEPCIMVLDSLGVRRIGIVKRIREYLTVEWRTKKKDLPLKEFDVMRACYPKVLLQDNSSDCGLFLLQYVENLFTSIKEGHPLPSTPQAWADYSQTNNKRDIIRTIILDLSGKQSGNKPTGT